jgi:transglutaminase-like putative cysteine protease
MTSPAAKENPGGSAATSGVLRTPPGLMFTVLLFWGWQTNLLLMGLLLGVVIEGSRIIQSRWEFHQDDFRRIWNLCTVLFIGASVYGFASNDGAAAVTNLLEATSQANRAQALANTTKSVLVLFQWLPMVFAPIMAAQVYGNRELIDVSKFSWLARRRARSEAGTLGQFSLNVSFPFFALSLFSASAANANFQWFFPALVGFIVWALWFHRPVRYSKLTWIGTVLLVAGCGFGASLGLSQAQRMVEGLDSLILSRFGRQNVDSKVRTSLGSIGKLQLSNKIVYRLETEGQAPPAYLREGSYNVFKSPLWYVTRRDFLSVIPESETSWRLLPNKVSRRSVTISGLLPKGRGYLPLPYGTSQLDDLPVYALETNRMGLVYVKEGPGFLSFQAKYDKGASLDGVPEQEDFEIPLAEKTTVAEIGGQLGLSTVEAPEDVLRKLQSFFINQFEYTTWLGDDTASKSGLTPLGKFLTKTKKGHCEYFATATVLLLRQAGLPARYALGYSVQEQGGKQYIVREKHAHSWALVYYGGLWHDFDTTPPSWRELGSHQEDSLWQTLSDGWSRLWFEFNRLRWTRNTLRDYVLWGLVVLLALLLTRLFWKKRVLRVSKRKSVAHSKRLWPGQDSELYVVEKKLATLGLERQPAETFSAWLKRIQVKAPELPALHHLVLLHYQLRFDPAGLPPQDRAALREEARQVLERVSNR